MTKPITSVAAMMLYEEGAFELKDPVRPLHPVLRATCRCTGAGSANAPVLEPATEPMRIWHLLTHTSGLTYGFHHAHPVDAMYRGRRLRVGLARGPRPGRLSATRGPRCRWCSSRARSGTTPCRPTCSAGSSRSSPARRSTSSCRSAIFDPLGMVDTALPRARGGPRPPRRALRAPTRRPQGGPPRRPRPRSPSRQPDVPVGGGGGLVSHRGGLPPLHPDAPRPRRARRRAPARRPHRRLHDPQPPPRRRRPRGVRPAAASPRPPSTASASASASRSWSTPPPRARCPPARASYAWGGAASTAFWVDPKEDITVVFLTQLLPSSTHPIRPQLKQLVSQALVD